LKEDNRVGCLHLPHVWSLELGQRLVQVQGELSGRPAEEKSEEFLAKLKLLLEGRLVQSLVNLKLLAEVRMDSSLVRQEIFFGEGMIGSLESLKLLVGLKMGSFLLKLELLLEDGVIGFLVKLKFLLEKEMVEPLVNLDLKHAEGRRSPQVDSPILLLQILNKGQMPM
jgi:hypothetical protein